MLESRRGSAIRPEVKAAGLMDSKEGNWNFFIDRVRKNLHVVLCMSPVGSAFRIRCRNFPALTSCTVIDWFHAWPTEALVSVAQHFLRDLIETDEIRNNISSHMAFVHDSVGIAAEAYRAVERRFVYTTPKSYLELIALYNRELAKKRAFLEDKKTNLAGGLLKLHDAQQQLANMQLEDKSLVSPSSKKEATQKRVNLANRLINGLASEGVRWTNEVNMLDEKMRLLIGDVVLSSSFVTYIAPFSHEFRDQLVNEKWRPDVVSRGIPTTESFDPMFLLTDASKTAGWNAEGLPRDIFSTQNAAIICKAPRFPLIIDPQMQAVKWIVGHEKSNGLLTTVPGPRARIGRDWRDKVVNALEEGVPLLLENMKDSIEGVLGNLVARAYIKSGSKLQVALDDRIIDIATKNGQPSFRLYMQSRMSNPHYPPEVQAETVRLAGARTLYCRDCING